MRMSLRKLVEQLEVVPSLPSGSEERFNGYGVMGLPFTSGHILVMRPRLFPRFTESERAIACLTKPEGHVN